MPHVLLDYAALRSDAYRLLAVDEAWLRRVLRDDASVTATTTTPASAQSRRHDETPPRHTRKRRRDSDVHDGDASLPRLQLIMHPCNGRLLAHDAYCDFAVRRIEYFHTHLLARASRGRCLRTHANVAPASVKTAVTTTAAATSVTADDAAAVVVLAALTRTFDLQPTRPRSNAMSPLLLLLTAMQSQHSHACASASPAPPSSHSTRTSGGDDDGDVVTAASLYHTHYITLDELECGVAPPRRVVDDAHARDGGGAAHTRPLRFREWVALCRCGPRAMAASLTRAGAVVHRGRVRLLRPALLREVLHTIVAFLHTTAMTSTCAPHASCDAASPDCDSMRADTDDNNNNNSYTTLSSGVEVTWSALEAHLCPRAYPRVVVRAVQRCYGRSVTDDATITTTEATAAAVAAQATPLWCNLLNAREAVVGLSGYVFDTHADVTTHTLTYSGRRSPASSRYRHGAEQSQQQHGRQQQQHDDTDHHNSDEYEVVARALPLDAFVTAWRAHVPPSLLQLALHDKRAATTHTQSRQATAAHTGATATSTTAASATSMDDDARVLAGYVLCRWADAGHHHTERATAWWLPHDSLVADVAARVDVVFGLCTQPCEAQTLHAYVAPLLDKHDHNNDAASVERAMAPYARPLRLPGQPLQYTRLQ